jgi:hypothetical protein
MDGVVVVIVLERRVWGWGLRAWGSSSWGRRRWRGW